MRFLLYLNMIAIIWLAGALVQLYEGAPLPGYKAPPAAIIAEAPVRAAAPAPAPASALTPEKMAALNLPFPHPARSAGAASVMEFAKGDAAPIVILTEGDYPPFNYRDETGALRGFDVDLTAALCARLGLECRIDARGWDELVPALERGEGDAIIASMLIPSPGRDSVARDGIIFTKGYYSTPGRFAVRRGNVPPAANPAALAGRRIGVQAGSAHQAFALMRFPAAELVTFPGLAAAEESLAKGEIDLVFADRNALLRWLSQKEGACCRLVGPDYTDPTYFGRGAGIALKAGNEDLRDRFNEALASLVRDGTYTQISTKYFSDNIF